MSRRQTLTLLAVLPLVACQSGGSSSSSGGTSGSSGYIDAGPPYIQVDAGPPLDAGPVLVPGFGPFTGAYTVNGGGLLLAAQIDGHLGLLLNGEPNAYLGVVDAGILPGVDAGHHEVDAGHPEDAGHHEVDAGHEELDAGHHEAPLPAAEIFNTELVYPDLETCGPVTLTGLYEVGVYDYTATNDYCAAGLSVTASFPGARLLGDEFFRQDFSKSGVFDVIETPSGSNACTFATNGPFHATIGFSVDLDGGPSMAMVVGDGLLDEIEIPQAPSGGVLSAKSLDSQGNQVGSISLESSSGSHWTGSRRFVWVPADDDGGIAPCNAAMNLVGTLRTE